MLQSFHLIAWLFFERNLFENQNCGLHHAAMKKFYLCLINATTDLILLCCIRGANSERKHCCLIEIQELDFGINGEACPIDAKLREKIMKSYI